LAEARLSTTDPYLFSDSERAGFDRVRAAARVTRFGLDAYGYARLAGGTIDLVMESGLAPHDLDAVVPVIRAAGAIVTNWQGGEDLSEGKLLAAATIELADEARALLD
jgi:myo-inositol-1(or 4)-monophosphatase